MTTPDLADLRDRPVRTPADLQTLWRALMGVGGFRGRSVWLTFLDADGVPASAVMPIDDVPVLPDRAFLQALTTVVRQLVEDGSVDSVAILVSRPGSGTMTVGDRAWARGLAPLSPWPIHLATTDRVEVFAPDDLVTASA